MHTYTVASSGLRILRYFCCTGFVRAKPEGRKTAIGIWTTMICGLWNFSLPASLNVAINNVGSFCNIIIMLPFIVRILFGQLSELGTFLFFWLLENFEKRQVLFGAFYCCKVSNSILLASSPDHLPVLLLPRGAHLHHHHPHPQDRAHDRLHPGLQ